VAVRFFENRIQKGAETARDKVSILACLRRGGRPRERGRYEQQERLKGKPGKGKSAGLLL